MRTMGLAVPLKRCPNNIISSIIFTVNSKTFTSNCSGSITGLQFNPYHRRKQFNTQWKIHYLNIKVTSKIITTFLKRCANNIISSIIFTANSKTLSSNCSGSITGLQFNPYHRRKQFNIQWKIHNLKIKVTLKFITTFLKQCPDNIISSYFVDFFQTILYVQIQLFVLFF